MASLLHDHPRDRLTGLAGIDSALARIAEWAAAATPGGAAPVHAMLLGLRRFDTVNLAYGEAAGDSALVAVAARILHFASEELDGEWLAARVGGGSFLVAANEACSRERWQWLGETLAAEVARPITHPGGAGTLRLWPRVALMRVLPGEAPDAMFGRLAETLERTQRGAGTQMGWVDGEMTLAGRTAAQLEGDLLAALDHDEIEILFQPQFRSDDDALVGAEALARWHHPKLGKVAAGALFAIAERAEYVPQLSRHIASRALATAASCPSNLRLSLNVTPADLAAGNFAHEFGALLDESGFAAERLTLEITEQALLGDVERSAGVLAKLVERGVRIALDDFGAGFCNFRYLKLLPLHYLKLDRAMVEGIVEDERDLAVLRAIVALAKALQLEVIAEGIENEEQRALVAAEGCAFYQGFLRAAPMDAIEFAAFAAGQGLDP
jgi:EAL domain-containing protein (putative c-di-GMP-specific phosphodiesterase class I)/GGDEF domain-containing protein